MMINKNKCLIFLFLLLIVFYTLNDDNIAYAESESNGHIYIIIIDKITLGDLVAVQPPNIINLINKGALALMNTKVAGNRNSKSAYITIGAGTRAVYSAGSHLAFNSNELYGYQYAADIYKQRIGIKADPGEILNLSISQIIKNNSNKDHPIYPGELGKMLKQWGIRAAVLGNEDTDTEYSRNVVSIIMDDIGKVPSGNVSKNLLVRDINYPYSVKTDYERLWNETQRLAQTSDILVIQTGDTWRADDYHLYTTDNMLEKYRRQAILGADAFIGRLLQIIDLSRDLIMLLTPYPSAKGLSLSNSLTPFLIAGKNIQGGWAWSSTTKRCGIITNLDIAPTVLTFYGIPIPSYMLGHEIKGKYTHKTIDDLLTLNERLVMIYKQRPPLIQILIMFQTVTILTAFLLLQFKKNWAMYVIPFLYAIPFFPITFLLMSLWQNQNIILTVLGLIIVTFFMTFIAIKLVKNLLDLTIIPCLTISILIVYDLLFNNAELMKASALGYDVIAGSRYYGIGNEYMGVLISAMSVGMLCILERYRLNVFKYLLPLLYGGIIYILISPSLGTNVGGSIAAFWAFSVAIILLWRIKINAFSVTGLTAVMTIVLLTVFYLDSLRSVDMQSHIGQTTNIIMENGLISLFIIALRKIGRNIYLLRYTIWSYAFIVSYAILIFSLYRPVGVLKQILERYPYTAIGFKSAIVGSIMAFLANDSGVVAAAMAMIYVAPFLIAMIIREYIPKRIGV